MPILSVSLAGLFPDSQAMGQAVDAQAVQMAYELCDIARANWITMAMALGPQSGAIYVQGIQESVRYDTGASVVLVGRVPNLLENGQPAYDMHDTLLGDKVPVVARGSGKKGKHQKNDGTGFYRAIPFRHTSPTSRGSLGAQMGSAYRDMPGIDKNLAKQVYKAAKGLAPTTGMPGGPVQWGGRLKAGMAPKLKPHHHSDIYAGMVRQTKLYKNATQSQYTTFRTISTGSPGWQRKAVAGVMLAPKVLQLVSEQAPALFAATMKGLAP